MRITIKCAKFIFEGLTVFYGPYFKIELAGAKNIDEAWNRTSGLTDVSKAMSTTPHRLDISLPQSLFIPAPDRSLCAVSGHVAGTR